MSDATTCPDCGRTTQNVPGQCWAGFDGSDDGDHAECLRLALARARPVVEAARAALATIDRMTAAEADWMAGDATLAELHSLYDEANAETSVRLGELRAALDAYDGKAGES